jgi:hypothetical protein
MEPDARIAPRKPIDDLSDEAGGKRWCAPDPHLPNRRVGKKLDIFYRLAQVIEDGGSAIEQGATVGGRLHTLGVAVEQTHAHGSLQFCDRFGNGRLGRIEEDGRLVHAAGLHDRH